MTIGFDGSRAFDLNRTGTENYSYQLLKHLLQIDTQNRYLIYLRRGSKPDIKLPPNASYKLIPYKRLWTQLGLSLATFTDPIDVLFIPAHTLPIIRRPGLKTVMVAHDLGAEYLPQTHQLKQRLYLNFLTNFQFKSATKLIAVSQATKKDLINRAGCKPSAVEVIYEGIDRQHFKVPAKATRDKVLTNYNLRITNYFFFVGTIQPRKNLGRLIEAFELFLSHQPQITHYPLPLTNYQLVLAGGKGWLSDDIYKLPHLLGIEDKVIFLGHVADEDLPSLYSGALSLTFPSLYEGFGLPVLEALACGCPVITSNVSSLPEVAGKAALLINPASIQEISRAMELVTHKQVRSRLILDGFTQVNKFSWEKCAKLTLNVLESLSKP